MVTTEIITGGEVASCDFGNPWVFGFLLMIAIVGVILSNYWWRKYKTLVKRVKAHTNLPFEPESRIKREWFIDVKENEK